MRKKNNIVNLYHATFISVSATLRHATFVSAINIFCYHVSMSFLVG